MKPGGMGMEENLGGTICAILGVWVVSSVPPWTAKELSGVTNAVVVIGTVTSVVAIMTTVLAIP